MTPFQAGLLLIDKPEGVTSHAIVAYLRRVFALERIGHLGTLDPFASGVLPILLGGMTRMADSLMTTTKGYRFRICLGIETDTLDPSGQIIKTAPLPNDLSPERVEYVLKTFQGEQIQVPPEYSAIKHKGRPLYEYMRTRGKLDFSIEDRARRISIASLVNVTPADDQIRDSLVIEVHCSKGTYVRSLARDIAQALGTVGHCSELRRIAVGPWLDTDCTPLLAENVRTGRNRPSPDSEVMAQLAPKILTLEQVFDRHEPHYPNILVPQSETELINRLRSGNRIRVPLDVFTSWISRTHPVHDHLAGEGFIETPDRIFFSTFSMVEPDSLSTSPQPASLWVQIEPKKQIAAINL